MPCVVRFACGKTTTKYQSACTASDSRSRAPAPRVKARYPLATRLYVYGELCGGIYEHPRASAGVLPLKSFLFLGLGRDVHGGTFRFSGGKCAIPYYHSES